MGGEGRDNVSQRKLEHNTNSSSYISKEHVIDVNLVGEFIKDNAIVSLLIG